MSAFQGKVAIITGGASGIGRALGEELARRGAVVVLADIQQEMAAQAAAGIVASGGRATAVRLDVTDAVAVKALVDATAAEHGRLDCLFNNAGIGILAEAREYGLEHWNATFDVNLRGVVHGVHAGYPLMVKQGFGHIVNTASLAGLIPVPFEAAYVASKHAVVGISTTLRVEGAVYGVRCSVVCPGLIGTPILDTATMLFEDRLPGGREVLLESFRAYPVDRCAKDILRGVERNRGIIVVTRFAKVLWGLQRMSPALVERLLRREFTRTRRRIGGRGVPD